jgi:hypothetical protein
MRRDGAEFVSRKTGAGRFFIEKGKKREREFRSDKKNEVALA